MNRLPSFSLDYYDKTVTQSIVEKYGMEPMDAMRSFLTSRTHQMLEDAELAMWEFSASAVLDIWEAEQITGDPRNSQHIRSEL